VLIQDQVGHEVLPHSCSVHLRMAAVGTNLHVVVLSGRFESLNELDRIAGVYVVVGSAVVQHQLALKVLHILHCFTGIVTSLILAGVGQPVESLGIDRIVVKPVGNTRTGT